MSTPDKVKRSKFLGVFYSLPLTEWDKSKLLRCGAEKVMVTFDHGRGDLQWLSANKFDVVFRLDEPNYNTMPARSEVGLYFDELPNHLKESIEFIVVGVEPEARFNMRWDSNTGWGNEVPPGFPPGTFSPMQLHVFNFGLMRARLQKAGYKVCSPGYLCRNQDGKFGGPAPYHGPQPGTKRWKMYALEEYGKADYDGGHWYGFDGTPHDVSERAVRGFREMVEDANNEIILDEINIGPTGNPNRPRTKEEAMQGTLEIAEAARTKTTRIVRAYTFVQNGTPIAPDGSETWPPHQLMDTDECYNMMHRWFMDPNAP